MYFSHDVDPGYLLFHWRGGGRLFPASPISAKPMVNALPPAAESVGQRGVDADGARGKNREEEGALFHRC